METNRIIRDNYCPFGGDASLAFPSEGVDASHQVDGLTPKHNLNDRDACRHSPADYHHSRSTGTRSSTDDDSPTRCTN